MFICPPTPLADLSNSRLSAWRTPVSRRTWAQSQSGTFIRPIVVSTRLLIRWFSMPPPAARFMSISPRERLPIRPIPGPPPIGTWRSRIMRFTRTIRFSARAKWALTRSGKTRTTPPILMKPRRCRIWRRRSPMISAHP